MNNHSSINVPSSKRNGKIEWLRFVFCISVLLFHICKYIFELPNFKSGVHISLFSHGAMGVEFFFLVSGFLMAKSAYKHVELLKSPQDDKTLSQNYVQFIGRKYFSIFPFHVVAFILAYCAYVASEHMRFSEMLIYAAKSVPNFLLIEMSGINLSNPNHIEWYISCMLLAMAILYPLCIRYYYQFTRFFAPLIAILLLGYIQYTTGQLTGVTQWIGISYKSLSRAIAEIALGTTAFEISHYIRSRSWSKLQLLFFTFSEFSCFTLIMLFILFTFEVEMEMLVLFLLFILVTIAFSSVSYGSGLFNNKIFYFLGSISLPIYLSQLPAIYITTGFFNSSAPHKQFFITITLTFLFSIIVKIGGDGLKKVFNHTNK